MLRDAFDIAKTSESPQTEELKPLRFEEDPMAMRDLLNLMDAFKNPWQLGWIPAGAYARRIWELADKYDIVDLVRHTCLLIIHKYDCPGHGDQFEDEDPQFDYFVWAVTSKDLYLLGYVMQRWPLNDPVEWTRARIDIIGWELWQYLVKSFPRAEPGGDRDRWNRVIESPGMQNLVITGRGTFKLDAANRRALPDTHALFQFINSEP